MSTNKISADGGNIVSKDANEDVTGLRNVTATGSFIIGSADINETDLEKLDGITNGTAIANKCVVTNATIDITGLRNITATGTLGVTGQITASSGLTVGTDFSYSGHKNSQTFMVNAFQYPNPGTDWTPTITGAVLSGALSTKKCWLPLNFLKIGDEIVSYKITGDLVETVAGCIFNCKLVKINLADPITTTDLTGGAIAQVSVDGAFDVLATLSSVETVATDKQYLLEMVASLGEAADFAYVMGAEVLINRK